MKNIINFINCYKTIVLVNDSKYVGDSIIFFWPFLNALVDACLVKEVLVFHRHINLFKPLRADVSSNDLESFYSMDFALKDTIVIAFTPRRGLLKRYLQKKGFQSVVKDFVGLSFTTLNIKKQSINTKEYECICSDDFEYQYVSKINGVHPESGFPMLNEYFYNVYEYSKICNEKFLASFFVDTAQEGNIYFNNFNLNISFDKLFISRAPDLGVKFILINLISGTFKEDVAEKYDCLLNWIETISSSVEDSNVFILSNNDFPSLRFDLIDPLKKIYYLKKESEIYWSSLIKMSEKVYSIDTGFLHIAHVLNKNTFGFGGAVDFWYFKDKIIRIENCKNDF